MQLKLVRERKGLSRYQVFEVTRIQPTILKEIEEGTADMAEVFLKSFIKTYCRFLGLNFQSLAASAKDKDSDEIKNIEVESGDLKKNGAGDVKLKGRLRYLFPIAGLLILLPVLIGLILGPKIFKKLAQKEVVLATADSLTMEEEDMPESPIPSEEENQPQFQPQDQELSEQNLFERIKKSVFKQEILIQSSKQLKIYFKLDNRSAVNKTLSPFTWYYIKALESLYIRFDEKPGNIQLFHNGEQIDLGLKDFFERKFE